jgi:hypothetical protein
VPVGRRIDRGDAAQGSWRDEVVDFSTTDWTSLSPAAWSNYSRVKSAGLFEEMRRRTRMRTERAHKKVWETGKAEGTAAELMNRKRIKNASLFRGTK